MLRNLHRIGLMYALRCRPAYFVDKTSRRIETQGRTCISSNIYGWTTSNNYRCYSTSPDISIDNNSETINLLFDDGTNVNYPFVWLRDNCRCHACYDYSSEQKLKLLQNLDIDAHPRNTEIHTTGQSMNVRWSDGHRSEYPVNWLKDVRFPASMDPIDGLDVKYWGSELTKDKIPTFSFNDIMSDESSLYSWLASLHTYGINIVNDLGDDDKNLIRLADRVAYPKPTCHGVDFVVKATSKATDLAYTGLPLELHTDSVYNEYGPGVQIMHCIQMSEHGGSSEFADGFKVAYDLQKEDPETFKILSTVPLANTHQGINRISQTDYVLLDWKPIIRMNGGKVKQIALGYSHLDSRMSVDVADVKKVYMAMKKFCIALCAKENMVSFKLQAGEAICVNNIRALHGRSAFTVPAGCESPRHLQGIYLDWDEVYARMRGISAKSSPIKILS